MGKKRKDNIKKVLKVLKEVVRDIDCSLIYQREQDLDSLRSVVNSTIVNLCITDKVKSRSHNISPRLVG